jgi:hypothetical protein
MFCFLTFLPKSLENMIRKMMKSGSNRTERKVTLKGSIKTRIRNKRLCAKKQNVKKYLFKKYLLFFSIK